MARCTEKEEREELAGRGLGTGVMTRRIHSRVLCELQALGT